MVARFTLVCFSATLDETVMLPVHWQSYLRWVIEYYTRRDSGGAFMTRSWGEATSAFLGMSALPMSAAGLAVARTCGADARSGSGSIAGNNAGKDVTPLPNA
jgi:hypothetical protein